ncbi:hypothetical protein H5410_003727 [Solanum commersonii]|uniref:Uncharacterized protein n=1 Tax=Solanum commersonii TaxID=4109 RepID=A0A9J6B5X5_SOLCO|nr:hypothetical protein H5410_003727 [Solanum commersonii]
MNDHLLGGLNVNLNVGIITEIVDVIEAFSISIPSDHLEIWDYSQKAIECFCMRVRFERARLSKKIELGEAKEELFNFNKILLKATQV